MAETAKLAFGVEFELLLKPKEEFLVMLEQICPGWATRFEQIKDAESEAAAQDGTGTNRNAEAKGLRGSFRQQLAALLMQVGVPAATKSSKFEEWSVVDEPKLDEVPGYCKS